MLLRFRGRITERLSIVLDIVRRAHRIQFVPITKIVVVTDQRGSLVRFENLHHIVNTRFAKFQKNKASVIRCTSQ